jgi:8-oxo-dGTP pyrophosphatase MutT (NUDIX family)
LKISRIREVLGSYRPHLLEYERGVEASVLVPFIQSDEDLYIVLIKRTQEVGVHKGEVSFPGGVRKEIDSTPLETALRECYEEIGVRGDDVEVLGMMDEERTTTGFVIRPYVGLIPGPYEFVLNAKEVAYLLLLPIQHLGLVEFDEEASFVFEGERIWGATGRILKNLARILGLRND